MPLATFTSDPVFPWSLPVVGWPLFLGAATVLVLLTLATYLLRAHLKRRHLAFLLILRLAALALAFLIVLRPALAYRETENPPSTLIIVLDDSTSMNNRDELDRTASRWEYALRMLKESEPSLERLRDEKSTTIVLARFAGDVRDLDLASPGKAEGKRTDFSQMLEKLLERHQAAGTLRGLVIISDGADNGPGDPSPHELAEKWRKLPCKVHTIGCGDPASGDRDRDIVLSRITTDPPEVPIKNELTVTATIDSYGFKGSQVGVQLLVDDKPVDSVKIILTPDPKKPGSTETKNHVSLKCNAPDKPGDMKVTMKVTPMPGELTDENNQLTTFVPVTREGISILFIDRSRFFEPQSIFFALDDDERKRFRVYRSWLTDDKVPASQDFFRFNKEHYDVVILGDVTLAQLKSRDPQFVTHLKEQVEEKRTGLIWAGGHHSFSDPEWQDKTFAEMLPVEPKGMERLQGKSFHLEPTPDGWDRTIMRLAPERETNADAWLKLRDLEEATRLGTPKPGALILAQHDKGPLLAGYDPGKGNRGRVLVFGVDTTSRWIVDKPGYEAHRRFWQQVMLWLSNQDQSEGSVWIEAPQRRLLTGQPFRFEAGLRDRTGTKIKGGTFEAELVTPTGRRRLDLKDVDMGTTGIVAATDDPGEYRIEIKGAGKDRDDRPIPESKDAPPTVVRFVVMPNTAETAQKGARPDFLRELAKAGGGEFHEIKDLPKFLHKLEEQPLQGDKSTAHLAPDWKARRYSPIWPLVLLAFVTLLGLEWFCRRKWGMV